MRWKAKQCVEMKEMWGVKGMKTLILTINLLLMATVEAQKIFFFSDIKAVKPQTVRSSLNQNYLYSESQHCPAAGSLWQIVCGGDKLILDQMAQCPSSKPALLWK